MEAQDMIDQAPLMSLKINVGTDFLVELIDTYCVETARADRRAAAGPGCPGTQLHSAAWPIPFKSSSASLGALSLSQQARELEMLGKADDLDGAGQSLSSWQPPFCRW